VPWFEIQMGLPVRERDTPGVHQAGVGYRCEAGHVRNKVCLRKAVALATPAPAHSAANATEVAVTDVSGSNLFIASSPLILDVSAAQPVSFRPATVLVGSAAANRFGSMSSKH
jgi:hypothetical protein